MNVLLENRCLSIQNFFNSSFIQWNLIRRIKYYHLPCRRYSNLACFYDETHICTCYNNKNQRYTNCILFNHEMKHICQNDSGNCENGGECFQDDAKCPSISACHCYGCFYGSKCQFSNKGLSLSLDSILGYHIRPDRNFQTQIFVIKFSVILVIIMFIINIINGILSIMVFSSKTANEVGCGFYLLISSLFSILTMIILVLKFCFLLLTQMTWIINQNVVHIQCISIDFILQICLIFGDWLNATVAVERVIGVLQGVNFDKTKSKRIAKYTTVLLFIFIAITNLHDPINRHLIVDEEEQRIWCIVRYSHSLQSYNSIIKSFHFLTPFILNIISSLIIIYNIAKRRSHIQQSNKFKNHIYKQLIDRKHLLISPIALLLLALPRLIISLVSDCVRSDRDPWPFLIGYLTSFGPSLLIFAIFILPSETYKTQLKQSFTNIRLRMWRLIQCYFLFHMN
ncbi:hypothetical protein I4U23_011436 [Adineta vaga]|nr:hypothetical protein I4U23_011436 [Adineta vaga]